MKMNSSTGIFHQWLIGQIPQYIDNKISVKIGKIKSPKDGKHGVSVVDAEIAADDHLVLKLSDGEIIDAGELPKADGEKFYSQQLMNWQITVSATAPADPSINDLWYDIS